MESLQPILTTHLFPELHAALLALLRELSTEEWQQPTACAGWSVKDVAQHLLGDDIGKLSAARDGYRSGWFEVKHWDELVIAINQANEQWVCALSRISPQLLCEFLAITGSQISAYFATLDPYEIGSSVDWAGPEPAPVWLDLAREYTERWHHQQHIRDAVGKPGMKESRYLAPVLNTFLRALPHTFRAVDAPDDTVIRIQITGDAGGNWFLHRSADTWQLYVAIDHPTATTVTVEQERAWRLLTRGLSPAEIQSAVIIEGNKRLGQYFLNAVAIIA